jgi:SAM-dependent methyltransferase
MSLVGYEILRRIAPRTTLSESSPVDLKLDDFFGQVDFAGKTVIDFGCGEGHQAIALAPRADRVIGVDIQERWLVRARELAAKRGVTNVEFVRHCTAAADIVLSKDAFEHFSDVPGVLKTMAGMLKRGGYVLAAFGPTWLHPYGGHLFSVFPWAHLLFSEASLIRWRQDFKSDGATKFGEVEGGLNQLTIRQFERFVADSPLRIDWLEPRPIRGIRLLKMQALREFGSSIVRCKLVLR